jgi:hypothetical protein
MDCRVKPGNDDIVFYELEDALTGGGFLLSFGGLPFS